MVKVINWNPRKKIFKSSRFFKVKGLERVNNFGDIIGPLIVKEVLKKESIVNNRFSLLSRRLLTVGSILHFAKNRDTIWGTGRNGKIPYSSHKFRDLDVRAVRGPLTREFLTKKNINCPEVYGDPALLLPLLFESLQNESEEKRYDLTIIPNLNDFDLFDDYTQNLIDPRDDLKYIIKRIAKSRFVIGSSLHAIIVAESLGIPARLIQGRSEPDFKYEDYYLGTGRSGFKAARNVMSAIDMGGENQVNFGSRKLMESFPFDIF
ncbi:hypothetical protein BZG78_15235 [Salinivibrio sp. MA351]|uniref:polysaccharide pyruvyl transferase family protein n=1 Tax=Salinivibrio sp. MA351 TaxID=1909453 RepID=UPI000989561B|nr:polysaccharide pyruvyl transferase family protein [Salinivibrio sp. MA351]OOE95163.1 hypothetical protein BZG78_15235 [Salinivibrio sp. MA351]